MFTGIVESVGSVVSRRTSGSGVTFVVSTGDMTGSTRSGDSVAINGVCQTVEGVSGGQIRFTAVGETLRRTTLGDVRVGAKVNVERSATPETALGGHFVQGHVDGVGVVESFARAGQDRLLAVRIPEDLVAYVVPKGSIAIDGISLTVIEIRRGPVITITIIPFTLENTIAKGYRRGSRVNLEADILGKYVVNTLQKYKEQGVYEEERQ